MAAPPRQLVHALLSGPSLLTGFEWHDRIDSTMRRASERAAQGHAEGYVVAADVQTAGRGRQARPWTAPAGTSLLLSVLLRPPVDRPQLPLLSLLAGVALVDTVQPRLAGVPVTLKWPNDLLVGGAKAAGILLEAGPGDGAVLGIGLNVDWRGVDRPAELADATSLAEAAGGPVDRWRVFAGLAGVLGNRYRAWCEDPSAFLDDYRARCATLGGTVRVTLPGGDVLTGHAEAITGAGALRLRLPGGDAHDVHAGDVAGVRRP